MSQLVKVNILTKDRIPWMNIQGPLYNVSISRRLYTLLSEDPRIKIELVDEVRPTESTAKEAYGVKEAISITPKEVPVVEEVDEIVDEVTETVEEEIVVDEIIVEETSDEELDAAIEEALNEEIQVPAGNEKDSINETPLEVEFTVYTKEELEALKKSDLKEILLSRGYTKGEFAPKYADTHAELLEKVLKTQ